MVEKRTMAFITLATLVWAAIASGLMTYYYLEQSKYQQKFDETQQLQNEITENYDLSTTGWNLLSGDYGALLGEYQWFVYNNWFAGENCSLCMDKYAELLLNLDGNFTWAFAEFSELNETFNNLLSEFQTLNQKNQVTKEEFGSLLDDFYDLFAALKIKELEGFLGMMSMIQVNLCIDYGNQTVKWYNGSAQPGITLFDLTQENADVQYSYWPTMEPGHILITSINNYAEGYWIWYYWDAVKKDWVYGPVGCDAWILSNNGIYKWACSS